MDFKQMELKFFSHVSPGCALTYLIIIILDYKNEKLKYP